MTKMINRILSTVLLVAISCITSCKVEKTIKREPGLSQEQLIEINRELLMKDRDRILDYINRKGLSMTETVTGLWHQIIKEGKGNIESGNRIKLEYDLSLLDGRSIYSSEKEGELSFSVDRSDVPSGLNEGVQLLGLDAEAIFIIPSYLAYGMLGDDRGIPPRSILVYTIKVIEIIN